MRTFFVVRHAKAGDREDWPGDDRLRPLTKKGLRQAGRLVELLAGERVTAVISSPYLRCVQTVEPLAEARALKVQQRLELGEGQGLDGAMTFLADERLDHVVLATHGDVVWELVEEMVRRHVIEAGDGGWDKGAMWTIAVDGDVIAGGRYTLVD